MNAAGASTRTREGAEPLSLGISDLAERYGLTLRTLRFWEAKGLVAPMRIGTRRLYDASQVALIEVILKAKALGFSLMEVREIVDAFKRGGAGAADAYVKKNGDEHRAHLEHSLDELRRSIETTVTALGDIGKGRSYFAATSKTP